MIQECEVFINITVSEKDKQGLINHIKTKLEEDKTQYVNHTEIKDISIDDTETELIVLTVYLKHHCTFVPGCRATRWEPGEPPHIEDYLEDIDFLDWAKYITNNLDYEPIEIEIDDDSYLPSEDALIEKYYEENYLDEEY